MALNVYWVYHYYPLLLHHGLENLYICVLYMYQLQYFFLFSALMIHIKCCESTLRYQRCPSTDLKQNTSLRQLAELCHANQQKHQPSLLRHIINTIYYVPLSKANVNARVLPKFEMMFETKQIHHQLRLKDVGSRSPLSNEPRLLNKIRTSTFLRSSQIGLYRDKSRRKQPYVYER